MVVLLLSHWVFKLKNSPVFADAGDSSLWTIKRITKNSAWDVFPKISKGNIVWRGYYKGKEDAEILLWNGKKIVNISHNQKGNEYEPCIDGKNIVWRTYNCNKENCKGNIYLYNGRKTKRIASYDIGPYNASSGYPPSWHSLAPTTHDGYVTWAAWDGNDYEIFLWKNKKTTQITDNDTDDFEPIVHNGQIAWTGYVDESASTFFWDGTKIKNISDNTVNNWDPYLYNGKIVWAAWNNSSYEIFYWDGIQIIQITNSKGNDYEPVLFGNEIIWHWWDGNDWEIMYYDGDEVKQITDNEVDDLEPHYDGSTVVWHSYVEEGGKVERIFTRQLKTSK